MEIVESKAGSYRAANDDVTEQFLIQRILAGEIDLYGLLADRYGNRIYRNIRHLVRNRMDAEDIIQDTHLRALTYLGQFSGRCKFATWLSRVAANVAFSHLRQQQRMEDHGRGMFSQTVAHSHMDFGFRDPETCVRDREIREVLRRALAELPPRYRSVFLLREVGHMKTLEVAQSLRIRCDNVRVKLYRARRMLRASISNYRQLLGPRPSIQEDARS